MYYEVNEDFLAHYGVLGMKWGHRKTQSSSGALSKRKQKKQRKQEIKAYKKYAKESYKDLKKSMRDKNGGFYETDNKDFLLDKRTGNKVSKKKVQAAYDWDILGRKRPSDVIQKVYGVTVTSAAVAAGATAGYQILKRKGII